MFDITIASYKVSRKSFNATLILTVFHLFNLCLFIVNVDFTIIECRSKIVITVYVLLFWISLIRTFVKFNIGSFTYALCFKGSKISLSI